MNLRKGLIEKLGGLARDLDDLERSATELITDGKRRPGRVLQPAFLALGLTLHAQKQIVTLRHVLSGQGFIIGGFDNKETDCYIGIGIIQEAAITLDEKFSRKTPYNDSYDAAYDRFTNRLHRLARASLSAREILVLIVNLSSRAKAYLKTALKAQREGKTARTRKRKLPRTDRKR